MNDLRPQGKPRVKVGISFSTSEYISTTGGSTKVISKMDVFMRFA